MSSVFSEYEVRELGIKVGEDPTHASCECIGTIEEEMNVRKITKSCRGVVRKTKVKATGDGTLKVTAHVPTEIYYKAFGMNSEDFKKGVHAYGEFSVHPALSITAKVLDEDDNVKFKAYPNCVMQKGVARKVENGAEEVAELELEIAVMPDVNGVGVYEAIETDITSEEELKTGWMTNFTPEMVKASLPASAQATPTQEKK